MYVSTDHVRHKTKTAKLVEFAFEEASLVKKKEEELIDGFDHTLRYYTERPSEV